MTALMDAVTAATNTVPRLYPVGGVPTSPIYPYGVLSAVLGHSDGYSLDARHLVRHGRVVAQTFGRTADSALDHMDKITARLLDKTLAATGLQCTPCRAELDPAVVRDPDAAGVIGVTATFAFTAIEEP